MRESAMSLDEDRMIGGEILALVVVADEAAEPGGQLPGAVTPGLTSHRVAIRLGDAVGDRTRLLDANVRQIEPSAVRRWQGSPLPR